MQIPGAADFLVIARGRLDKRASITEQTGRFSQRTFAKMLIDITGRGHSGSTILDINLGTSAQIESVGELMAGQRLGALQDWHATNPRLLLANNAHPRLSFERARPLTGRFCQGLTGRP